MTIWATIAVERGAQPSRAGRRREARRVAGLRPVHESFSSVFMANLTFFQTVVAGDSWGFMAIPVIEEYPLSAVVFVGSLLTLVFGVLNLIVAVVVDTFAESREKDVVARANDMDAEEIAEKRVLAKIFEKIDEDASGALSFDELATGAQKVAEFRHWLRVMDIDAHDLKQLFLIVDEAMYRMKNAESRTTSKFVKHIVTRIERDQLSLKSDLSSIEETLGKVASSGDGFLTRAEEELHQRLGAQEAQLQRAVEIALSKASEVALEAGLHAATGGDKKRVGQLEEIQQGARRRCAQPPPAAPPRRLRPAAAVAS
eukprot:CAMPEP_0115375282 /NCGR_PEP_ID=MMETSP0271-20121206/2382_1 /TAXON_ID=71861 /ORGANISM="Scrippsiella trochoidea, Strain CCMP3099" /LENGTH=313 /DNA_ID=CAMNT_0002798341 /DNA_START=38 /DNA_END=976 /DNA_ORIENTATION=-